VHGTIRYKMTLSKLYQIGDVLGAARVAARTDRVCQIVINTP